MFDVFDPVSGHFYAVIFTSKGYFAAGSEKGHLRSHYCARISKDTDLDVGSVDLTWAGDGGIE